ncbi:hypothetical protein FRC03_008903 [Tulasnella sp. 419]|nr:hypothetical protein FRC03_008903 [Tulasnella sp. 419]
MIAQPISLLLFLGSALAFGQGHQHRHHRRATSYNRLERDSNPTSPAKRAAISLPSGWAYVGCWSDLGSARTLSKQVLNDNTVSVNSCIAACEKAGYIYGGPEYNHECWCGNSLGSQSKSIPESTCNMKCAADSSQICGAGNAISLYAKSSVTQSATSTTTTSAQSTSTQVGGTYVGCYVDSSTRLLNGAAITASTLTISQCVSRCGAMGFSFAGAEAGKECYCGNSISGGSKVADTQCSTVCAGDANQKCGGGWRLSVYTSSPSSSQTSRYNNVPLGCYADSSNRVLGSFTTKMSNLTPQLCVDKCSSLNYALAGVEAGIECYCANALNGGSKVSDTECSYLCGGDSDQTCGGNWRLRVYNTNPQTATSTSATSTSSSSASSTSTTASTSTSTSATSTSTSSAATSTASGYVSYGCYSDQNSPRSLPTQASGSPDLTSQTVAACNAKCAALGKPYAGTQAGTECWCGDCVNAISQKVGDGECNLECSKKNGEMCGGSWRLSVQYNKDLDKGISCAASTNPTLPSDYTSPDGKLVVAHFMVGNAYSFTKDTWKYEMGLALEQGIDAFALNLGSDWWQEPRIQDAYDVARDQLQSKFKLFFSFDITVMDCWSQAGADRMRSLINKYANHAAQLRDTKTNKIIVSTFGGEACTFGRGSPNAGWNYAIKENMPPTLFLPSFFSDPIYLGNFPCTDGDFHWNGGWTLGNFPVNWDADARHKQYTASKPQYMTSVSPWFFTHYGPNSWNKNWIYRGDDHHYARRWEDLVAHRSEVDIVQIVTWNDYGESSYIGPIGVDQPNSQQWVNGFDHQGWLSMTGYYVKAFKQGQYPAVTADKVVLWTRPHGKDDGSGDYVPRPTNYIWTTDNLWCVLFAKEAGTLQLCSGSSCATFQVSSGVNKLKVASAPGKISAKLTRNGAEVFNFSPAGFSYTNSPSNYNFNAFVAAGP